jgi:hypothetical protein
MPGGISASGSMPTSFCVAAGLYVRGWLVLRKPLEESLPTSDLESLRDAIRLRRRYFFFQVLSMASPACFHRAC